MARGLFIVRSRPSSPEETADYHRWYDEVHLPEILGVEGFVWARRLQADDGESFAVVYEVADVDGAKEALAKAQSSGAMTRPTGVQLDPPPSVEWFTDLSIAPA